MNIAKNEKFNLMFPLRLNCGDEKCIYRMFFIAENGELSYYESPPNGLWVLIKEFPKDTWKIEIDEQLQQARLLELENLKVVSVLEIDFSKIPYN